MAPSLFTTFKHVGVAAVACASTVHAAAQSYQMTEEYTADNFFDKFDFFTSTYTDGDSWDPTHGYVQYRSQADAERLGLIATANNRIYIGADANSTYDPEGTGRDSVRLTSKARYNGGLMVASFAHLPAPACGAWPAFWTYASPWLTTGEIDFYEGWNRMGFNRIAMHVNETLAGACTLSQTGVAGTVLTDDCNNDVDGSGCGVRDSTAGFWGSATGGTVAWEWTDAAIKVWTWTPDAVPADVTAGSPDPGADGWGAPQLLVEQSQCDLAAAFGDLQLTFNIDFCGDTAGSPSIWNATCAAQGSSCAAYVAENPSAFADTYFSVEGIRFYELQDVVVATTSASPASSSASPSVSLEASADAAPAAPATTAAAFSHTTSYIYGTATSTDENGAETTVVVVVDTTICPVTATEAATSSLAAAAPPTTTSTSTQHATSTSTQTQLTTSTIFSTSRSTISSCAATASACTPGDVTTVVVAVSTTVCPVTATESATTGAAAAATGSVGVVSGAASLPSGSATSENAAHQATTIRPSSSASAVTLVTSTASSLSSSSSLSSAAAAGTTSTSTSSSDEIEVETATDTAGPLETASGAPTGSGSFYQGFPSSLNGTATSASSAAGSTSSCSGLDCVVVASNGPKSTDANALGASGFALAVFAAAMFLL